MTSMSRPGAMYAPIPMVAGPVTLHPAVIQAMAKDYGSGQSEPDFLPLYRETAGKLATLMSTDDDVILMTGEGMLALWGALKSCLKPGDTVLTVGTGVFGDGMADMAESLGCKAVKVSLPYDSTIGAENSLQIIEDAIRAARPTMITAVHCETPSGTLNPLAELGEMKKRLGVPLFCVDAVASLGGAKVDAKAWNIDIVMAGSQKCLSVPPSMSIVSVSPTAWDIMEKVKYQGYDAILPFRTIYADGRCPYTPYWHGVAALNAAADALFAEGLDAVFDRHDRVARECREGLGRLGLALFPRPEAVCAPTVTAVMVPEQYTWADWRRALRDRGLVVSGSFGPMAEKVFRLGHMGMQADSALVSQALEAIADALR